MDDSEGLFDFVRTQCRVIDMRQTLSLCGLPTSGNKKDLSARLRPHCNPNSPWRATIARFARDNYEPGYSGPEFIAWPQKTVVAMQRAAQLDPFWRSAPLTAPVELLPTLDSSHLYAEAHFHMADDQAISLAQDKEGALLQLQVVCMMRGDQIDRRCYWPDRAVLRVNSFNVPVPERPSSNLGPHPVSIGNHCHPGQNVIHVFGIDTRTFDVVVRFATKVGVEELIRDCQPTLFDMTEDESWRTISGVSASDNDIVCMTPDSISLRCPLGGSRMKIPARLAQCKSVAHCFDLSNFLELAMIARHWTCPICRCQGRPADLRVEPLISKIIGALDFLGGCDDDVDVECDPERRVWWRRQALEEMASVLDA